MFFDFGREARDRCGYCADLTAGQSGGAFSGDQPGHAGFEGAHPRGERCPFQTQEVRGGRLISSCARQRLREDVFFKVLQNALEIDALRWQSVRREFFCGIRVGVPRPANIAREYSGTRATRNDRGLDRILQFADVAGQVCDMSFPTEAGSRVFKGRCSLAQTFAVKWTANAATSSIRSRSGGSER